MSLTYVRSIDLCLLSLISRSECLTLYNVRFCRAGTFTDSSLIFGSDGFVLQLSRLVACDFDENERMNVRGKTG